MRSVLLSSGDAIKVKAVGDGVNYTDGDYSSEITYTAPEPTKLGDVTLTLKGHTASWEAVESACRYAYQINGGEVVETMLRSVVLSAGDTIRVKAIGDGVDYIDGDYCATVTHATIYDGPINDGPVVLTINALDKLSSATVVSGALEIDDNPRIEENLKNQGNGSYRVYYGQTLTVSIPMLRNGVAMTRAKLALYDELRLWVMIPVDSNYGNIVPSITIGSQVFPASTLTTDGWQELKLNVDQLIADGLGSAETSL